MNKIEFYGFLEEYAEFFSEMENFEKKKLDALLSGKLSEIESALSSTQANVKQVENIEIRRIKYQNDLNLTDMTFSQILADAPIEYKDKLSELFSFINQSVDHIKFYNNKSMQLAENNLRLVMQTVEKKPTTQMYGQTGEKLKQPKRVSMWETSV